MRNKKPAAKNVGLDLDPKVIELWRNDHSDICQLYEVDALSFLKGYDFQGNELVYADPPYLPETRQREKVYRCEYTYEDHTRLLKLLVTLPCMVMISGYSNDLYDLELLGWRKISFSAMSHSGVRVECVWMNFEPQMRLHDSRFMGDTYRDRQTIQRRQARLRSRIDSMDPVERNDLLQWMQDNYGICEEVA